MTGVAGNVMVFKDELYYVPETVKKKIMFLGNKVRLVRKADNLTAIYELIV
jgi:hypothetical protein